MRKLLVFLLALVILGETACAPLEVTARNTLAASGGAITTYQDAYKTFCTNPANAKAVPCVMIHNAIAAQNTTIDALEVYCAGPAGSTPPNPTFAAGGPCVPNKSAQGILQAALQSLGTIVKDIKGLPAQPGA